MPEAIPRPPSLPKDPGSVPVLGFARRNRHWTVPVLLPLLFLMLGFSAATMPQYRDALVAAAAVASGAMYLAAPHKWDRAVEQWYARLSVLVFGGWLCAVSWAGLTWTMTVALFVLALAWGVPWYVHKRPRDTKAARGITGQWNEWWQHHAVHWGVAGSGVREVTTKGPVVTLRVQLWAGRQHARQVEDIAHLIESALRGFVDHGMVRVARAPGNPSQVLVHLKQGNPLARAIRWDASMVPLSVLDQVAIGLGEDGRWLRVVLASNWFITGKSRSGKSNQLSVFLAVITGVPDARAWLIDRKGGRAARPWMPALDWCAVTIEEARTLLAVAVAEVEARAMHAYDGTEQLVPTPEVPALFVIVDEAHEVTSQTDRGDARCASLLSAVASMGMGVAVYTVVLTQHGTLELSVGSEQTRANLVNSICFAVRQASHGAYALSDWAKLDASKLREKGSFYAQIGPDASSVPERAPEMSHELVEQIAARNGAMPRRPLVLYAADHQEVYDMRWSRLPAVFRPLAPQCEGGPESPSPAFLPRDGETPGDDMPGARERVEADVAALPDTDLAGLTLPSDEEIRSETARRRLRFAVALMNAPDEGVTPRQLVTATGLSRSWIHQQLSALADAGAVIKVGDGRYRGTGDVREAMEAVRRGHAALLSASA